MNVSSRGRGRPPLAEAEELRIRAIGILLRDGYAAATMTGIAGELGMSVRTLHRYFPTKADIVWGGLEGAIASLRRGFAEADPDAPLVEALVEAVASTFGADADGAALSRARFRAIATTPELQAARAETFRAWHEETAAFLAARRGTAAQDVVTRSAAAAVQAAITDALLWWATYDDAETPGDVVARALAGLRMFGTE